MKHRAILALLVVAFAGPASAQDKKPPYWASIASGQAMMRTGPGRNYPGTWLYHRRDLPIRVLKVYPNWRLVEDPDGTQGWMLVTLLSDRRTALIKAGDPRPIRVAPDAGAKVHYLAQAGVVGRIDKCRAGWCRIEIGKRTGYISTGDMYGLNANEVLD